MKYAFRNISGSFSRKMQKPYSCIIDPDGNIVFGALKNKEGLFFHEYNPARMNFGRQGRIAESRKLVKNKACWEQE